MTVENIVHVEVRKLYIDANPPRFDFEDNHPDHLVINYESSRRLYDLMDGLIEGVGEYFSSPIKYSREIAGRDGGEICKYHLTFSTGAWVMDPVVADKRLTRYKAKLDAVKKILEDKSRELFLANQEEQKANAYLQNIIRSMQSCLIVTDAQCTIQVVNQATLELLGYELQDIEGKSLSILNVEGDSIGLTNVEALSSIDTLVRQEVKYRAKNGEKVPVLFSSSAMYDAEDQLNGIVCVALDLFHLQNVRKSAPSVWKDGFYRPVTAGVAHEINNLMGFIFSNLGTLSEYVEDIIVLLETGDFNLKVQFL